MENETHMVSMAVFSKTHNFKKAIPNSVRSKEMLASLFKIILALNVGKFMTLFTMRHNVARWIGSLYPIHSDIFISLYWPLFSRL